MPGAYPTSRPLAVAVDPVPFAAVYLGGSSSDDASSIVPLWATIAACLAVVNFMFRG